MNVGQVALPDTTLERGLFFLRNPQQNWPNLGLGDAKYCKGWCPLQMSLVRVTICEHSPKDLPGATSTSHAKTSSDLIYQGICSSDSTHSNRDCMDSAREQGRCTKQIRWTEGKMQFYKCQSAKTSMTLVSTAYCWRSNVTHLQRSSVRLNGS